MKITGTYFAVAYRGGPLALTVQRTSKPGEVVEGWVRNGYWKATFNATEGPDETTMTIEGQGTVDVDLVWQGAELPEGEREDYGFGHVLEQLKGGYTLE